MVDHKISSVDLIYFILQIKTKIYFNMICTWVYTYVHVFDAALYIYECVHMNLLATSIQIYYKTNP